MTTANASARPGTVPDYRGAGTRMERFALYAVETAARRYAAITHGNLGGEAYRRREEARDQLLDALAQLDAARGKA